MARRERSFFLALRIKIFLERLSKQEDRILDCDNGRRVLGSRARGRGAAQRAGKGRVPAMNLRHIDPRSTDWMDAMLEGEMDRGRQRSAKPEADQQVISAPDEIQMLSASERAAGPLDMRGLESRPPPIR